MFRQVLWAIGGLNLLAGLALGVAVLRGDQPYGVAGFWRWLAGPPDLGAVDFTAVTRARSGNDALICPPGLCGGVPVDAASPVFAVPVERLKAAVAALDAADPDLTLLERSPDGAQERYLARTKLMRYPDTINVRYVALDEGRSALALHSRSQIGRRDFGVNRMRLEGWLASLARELPVAQP
jgi:hypothetical protein